MASTSVTVTDLEKLVTEMKYKGLCRELRNDYAVLCPHCYQRHQAQGDNSYRKLKLYIDKDMMYGHCFRCGSVFLSDDQTIRTDIKRMESPVDMSNWSVCKLSSDGYWSLDRFNEFDEYDEEGVNYLARKRLYIYRDMYKALGIRFKDHNPIVPFYYKGELIFYQMRIIDPNSRIKYYTPKSEYKNPYILEHGENKHFIICEGTFDAIACRVMYPDKTPFAILGSDITEYQIAMLRSYVPESITIYMDKTELSRNVMRTIQKFINYCDFNIIPSNGQDPEEALKERLLTKLDEEY